MQRIGRSHSARIGSAACALTAALAFTAGCAPTVAIQAPKEPIVINMNIKVEHEIKMSVDNDLEQMFDEEEGIF